MNFTCDEFHWKFMKSFASTRKRCGWAEFCHHWILLQKLNLFCGLKLKLLKVRKNLMQIIFVKKSPSMRTSEARNVDKFSHICLCPHRYLCMFIRCEEHKNFVLKPFRTRMKTKEKILAKSPKHQKWSSIKR